MNISRLIISFAFLLSAFVANADAVRTAVAPVIDGKLDDACWNSAKWEGDFQPRKIANNKTVDNKTEFAVLCDDRFVYVGVKLWESDMDAVRSHAKPDLFGGDTCEIFMGPTGRADDCYHFVVCPTFDMHTAIFYGEGGLTHPDPFDPKELKHAAYLGNDFWSVEIAVPLKEMYMTRNSAWNTTWIFNVARVRVFAKPAEITSWSQLDYRLPEPKNFRTLNGFPMRRSEDDCAMTHASVSIDASDGKSISGDLAFQVNTAVAGKYRFESEYCQTTDFDLKTGLNEVKVRCTFEKPTRYFVPMKLTRLTDGETFTRTYQLKIAFEPIHVSMKRPEYRNNFYPGQDSSKVSGYCMSQFGLPITVTLERKDGKTESQTFEKEGYFEFATPDLKDGDEAYLTISAGGDTEKRRIRCLPKSKHRSTWIENGNLVMDGKPFFRLNVYGWNSYDDGYRCSRPFMDRIHADGDFGCTTNMLPVDLEYHRTPEGRGAKAREGIYDQKPSQEVLDGLTKRINEYKDKDFGYYYINDEPECSGQSPVYLKYIYEHIAEQDPYHVCLMCSKGIADFLSATDVIEPHPYFTPRIGPDGERETFNMETMGWPADAFTRIGRTDKVLGATPAGFAFRELARNYDYPTFDEYLANSWALIMGGAKTLYPFILDCIGHRASLYEGTHYMYSSIHALEDLLLFGKRTRIVKDKQHEVVVWEYNDEKFFAALDYTGMSREMEITGIDGETWLEFRGDRKWTLGNGETLKLNVRPYELIIGTTKKKDEGLPSQATTLRKIEALEWARTHRDNQLFERDVEMSVTASETPLGKNISCIVDGVRDNEALTFRPDERPRKTDKSYVLQPAWMSFRLKKEPITFRQLHIYGKNINLSKLEIRNGDTWREIDSSARENGQWDILVTLPETVTADEIRLTFGMGWICIYELEIPYVKQ